MPGFAAISNNALSYSFIDFWGALANISPTTTPADIALGNIVISGLPAGLNIVRVTGMFSIGMFYSALANKFNGASRISIKKSTGTWGVDDVEIINFIGDDLQIYTDNSAGSILLFGNADIQSEIDGEGTYNTRWEDCDAHQDGAKLSSIQSGLRFHFSV